MPVPRKVGGVAKSAPLQKAHLVGKQECDSHNQGKDPKDNVDHAQEIVLAAHPGCRRQNHRLHSRCVRHRNKINKMRLNVICL